MSRGVPGTQPEGIRDEREASAYVRRMFSQIAPRYDLLNHLLSLNLDKLWRARAARRFASILQRPGARVLDLCCGTGDLLFALRREGARRGEPGAQFLGSDFAHPMLVRAREKSAELAGPAEFAEADALQLPFADDSFDLLTAAFGFRNLANYQAGLREMRRVLKPGGELGILEFSAPRNSFVASLYKFYFTQLLPRVGGAVSGSGAAYSYLPASVMKFPAPDEFARWMAAAGFADARFESWTAGIVTLHTGKKA